MAVDSVAVPVAPSLYRRFERLAALTHRPVDSLIEQALSAAIPPLPEDVPAEMRHALAAWKPSRTRFCGRCCGVWLRRSSKRNSRNYKISSGVAP